MRIISSRPVNLHTKPIGVDSTKSMSFDGGLVHVPAKKAVTVPDSVADHPGFEMLVDDGTVQILREAGKKPAPDAELVNKQAPPVNTFQLTENDTEIAEMEDNENTNKE